MEIILDKNNMPMMEIHRTEVLRNNQWAEIRFMELKKGEKGRIYEAFEPLDGKLSEINGKTEFITTCDAYLNEKQVKTINIT